MPENFHRVIEAASVEEKAMLPFIVNGWPLFLCRDEGTIYAIINRCTHAAAEFVPAGASSPPRAGPRPARSRS